MLWQQMASAAGVFSATNIDDIVILTLLFSSRDPLLRPGSVVAGQVLGFALLVAISLGGFVAQGLLQPGWLALLGLLPISMGITRLIESPDHEDPVASASPDRLGQGPLGPLLGVTALTLANGSDNIGVYLPMFSQASGMELGVTLITFGIGLVLWCLLALGLSRAPVLAMVLQQRGERLVAPVLIAIGLLILGRSTVLEERHLAVIALSCLLVMIFPLLRQLQSRAIRGE